MAIFRGRRAWRPLMSTRSPGRLAPAARGAARAPWLGDRPGSALRLLLLLAALLISQWGLLLHGVEHDLHPPSDVCVVCLVANHLGHGPITVAHGFPAPLEATAEFPSVTAAFPSSAASPPRARAPPAQLLA
jgi:hypothetical protein